jgi:hypothetical protein
VNRMRFNLLATGLFSATLAVASAPARAAVAGGAGLGQDSVHVDARTETIINGALRYLAANQQPNGSWGASGRERQHNVAMTGYALVAFIAAGHLPTEGEYARTVNAGMQFLLDAVTPDGLYIPPGQSRSGQYMYEHGIATIALTELYGQTRSAVIRPKLERTIKRILESQNNEGGWRYHPFVRDADISVTVLQAVALRAAKNAGLTVPQENIDRAIRYVKSCYVPRSGGFAYQPGKQDGFARTAAATYSLQVLGLYDDPMVQSGSQYMLRNKQVRDWFAYGHFYAAPAQYMVGGDTWRKWYTEIRDLLVRNVRQEGGNYYWDTSLDRRAPGPIFTTAAFTTILAMPYHYVPLYQR